MTISTTENRKEYAGNDVTTSFAYPFKFFADSDLVVELVDTATNTSVLQTLTSDYTVIGAGLDAGGSVEMIVEPATGEQLVIYWDAAATQLTDYVENDSFPAESHEDALDKLTRLVQRLQDRLNRSVVLSDTDTSGVGLEIPEAALLDRALQFLSFDAAGNLTVAGVVGDIGSFTVSAANIANAIVQRDGNGDFAANEVTAALVIAALTGNVTGDVTGNLTGNSAGTHTGAVVGNADTATALANATYEEGTISADGLFTGGTVRYARMGKMVLVSWTGLTSAAQTAAAMSTALPVSVRPNDLVQNVVNYAAAGVQNATVINNGILNVSVKVIATGAALPSTSYLDGSVSYVLP